MKKTKKIVTKEIVTDSTGTSIEIEAKDSVELKRGANGAISITVKCYNNNILIAKENAAKVLKQLDKEF